jgi:hypothetical protein
VDFKVLTKLKTDLIELTVDFSGLNGMDILFVCGIESISKTLERNYRHQTKINMTVISADILVLTLNFGWGSEVT